MPSGKEYFESLGLEIAKRKYYNAAKVESVIGEFSRRAAALEEENASLRKRVEALACGREEIGEAILSAKTISQQLIAEAKEQAETILAEASGSAFYAPSATSCRQRKRPCPGTSPTDWARWPPALRRWMKKTQKETSNRRMKA